MNRIDAARAIWSSGDYATWGDLFAFAGQQVVDQVGVAGLDVLDVATGTGNTAIAAARAGGRVAGLDLTPELLDIARQRAADAGLDIRWLEGDMTAMRLPDRSFDRVAFGAPLADLGVVRQDIAESRLEIEQARLLCYRACHVIDVAGNKAARDLVAMAKVAVPRAATRVIDRAIQVYGGAGVTDVTPLAAMYAWHRAMRLFDGPDEVHLRGIAKSELRHTPVLPPAA